MATPASAPTLNGASNTIPINGADRRQRNIQNDVSETALTPAMFIAQHATTTANAMNQP